MEFQPDPRLVEDVYVAAPVVVVAPADEASTPRRTVQF